MSEQNKVNQQDVENAARAMASYVGWHGWDTATDFTHTPDGSDPDDERDYWRGLARVALNCQSPLPIPEQVAQEVTQQAASDKMLSEMVDRARLATDAHCDGLSHEPSKEYSDAYFYRMITQQAAKAQAAEQAEGEQVNVPPPFAAPAGQLNATVAALTDSEIDTITDKHSTSLGGWEWSGDIIDVGAGRDYDFARDIEAEVTRRFRAQGGNTNTESSDLAPTTSTVSASGALAAEGGNT